MHTPSTIRHRMNATGIGFAGIAGAWWLPAVEPFALPAQVATDLARIAHAIFCLFDTVTTHYGTPTGVAWGLNALLEAKVPDAIPRLTGEGRVLAVRPDFQLVRLPGAPPRYQLVATELEICPSAHGFAHAMQVGYGLRTDLVEQFAQLLAGRELIFAGTSQWSEFLFEQLAFCRALAEIGARGRVLYDLPVATIAERVRNGERWQPPIFGIRSKPAGWQDDVWARILQAGLEHYLWPSDTVWPAAVDNAVVFRFGYFDCFTKEKLAHFAQWQARGATLLNPTHFILDSKVIMAALQLPGVRRHLADLEHTVLPVLDACIPKTILFTVDQVDRLMDEQADWVLKFAGYDSGNQAWGGRSLQIGAQQSTQAWRQILARYLALPWPVVAQRAVPSAKVDIAYLDIEDSAHWLQGGTTRLRTFMLRPDQTNGPANTVLVGGSHITVSGGTMQVSESTDAVQAPVRFV